MGKQESELSECVNLRCISRRVCRRYNIKYILTRTRVCADGNGRQTRRTEALTKRPRGDTQHHAASGHQQPLRSSCQGHFYGFVPGRRWNVQDSPSGRFSVCCNLDYFMMGRPAANYPRPCAGRRPGVTPRYTTATNCGKRVATLSRDTQNSGGTSDGEEKILKQMLSFSSWPLGATELRFSL
jgi:hypothetical protein